MNHNLYPNIVGYATFAMSLGSVYVFGLMCDVRFYVELFVMSLCLCVCLGEGVNTNKECCSGWSVVWGWVAEGGRVGVDWRLGQGWLGAGEGVSMEVVVVDVMLMLHQVSQQVSHVLYACLPL